MEQIVQAYDVLGVVGNGSSIATLSEAGIEDNDVFIAITGSDELNLLCCMFAKKAGSRHTIARVRNPSYSHELDFIRQQTGISAIINPEMTAATEISRLLRFPRRFQDRHLCRRAGAADQVCPDPGPRAGRAAHPGHPGPHGVRHPGLRGGAGQDRHHPGRQLRAAQRDLVTFLATRIRPSSSSAKLGIPTAPVKNAMIVGGGAIAFYLSQYLLENKIKVRIIERDLARCDYLAEELPEAQVLCEDGSNRSFLLSEGLGSAEALWP